MLCKSRLSYVILQVQFFINCTGFMEAKLARAIFFKNNFHTGDIILLHIIDDVMY